MKAEEFLSLAPERRAAAWSILSPEQKARVGQIEKGLPATPTGRPKRGIVLTTTSQIDGCEVTEYLQIIGAEIIFGANLFKDALAQVRDLVGGRSGVYEKVYADARTRAIEALKAQATSLAADAVVGVKFDVQALGHDNGMHMVAATGTAVRIADLPDVLERRERAYEEQRDRAIKAFVADEPVWQLEIGGKFRGPFSVTQIRDLVQQNRLDTTARVLSADGSETTAGELCDRD